MRLVFALILGFLALMLVALLLLVYPIWGATTHCTTYEEKTLGLLKPLCDDGTRGVRTGGAPGWQSPVTPVPSPPSK
jgi:hypothetical protein